MNRIANEVPMRPEEPTVGRASADMDHSLGRSTRVPFRAPANYQLLRVVGSGTMGTVLLARDRGLGRLVALKFLRESCGVFLERFQREGRIMARLAHPSVVNVHALDVFEGRMYLAMEYKDGGHLGLARLGPDALVRSLRGVVDALEHAHQHGIVHRDVKPENVLLDRTGQAFLSDFGLALDPDEGGERCADRPVLGTPLTMSPEQARGEHVTPASDVFSFGTTLYERLTGTWPFRGRTLLDVLDKIQSGAPTPLRSLDHGIPRSLEAIVLACLAKRPEDRIPSMAELGHALDHFTDKRRFQVALSNFTARLRPARPAGPRIHPEELS